VPDATVLFSPAKNILGKITGGSSVKTISIPTEYTLALISEVNRRPLTVFMETIALIYSLEVGA
jgi:hypothetical protein